MKKALILLVVLVLSEASAYAYVSNAPMARLNKVLRAVMVANPMTAQQLGEAERNWEIFAHSDCKARLGLPMNRDALTTNPAFDECIADQFNIRAEQLERYACRTMHAFCGAK